MEPSRAKHVSEEDLERYSMNQLAEPELGEVEMHLLVCVECQDRVTESDRFVRSMRVAGSKLRREPVWRLWPAWWRPALAVAFAVGLLIVAGVHLGSRNAAPALAVLQASRGPMPAHSQVPAGRPVQLQMDLTDLAAFPRLSCGGGGLIGGAACGRVPQRYRMGAPRSMSRSRSLKAAITFVFIPSPPSCSASTGWKPSERRVLLAFPLGPAA